MTDGLKLLLKSYCARMIGMLTGGLELYVWLRPPQLKVAGTGSVTVSVPAVNAKLYFVEARVPGVTVIG